MLLHGDCLDLLAAVPEASANMIFADLPYAHLKNGRKHEVTKNYWDEPIAIDRLWTALLRAASPNCPIVMTATQPFASYLITSQLDNFRYDLIWEKNRPSRFVHAKRMPLLAHESVLIFYRKPPTYNPQMLPGESYVRRHSRGHSNGANWRPGKQVIPDTTYNGRYPRTVLRFNKDENTVHPNQKPVALLEWIVKTYTNPGDIVLDPTMGSGTTGVACAKNGRRFIGIEKDENYFALAKDRIEKAQSST